MKNKFLYILLLMIIVLLKLSQSEKTTTHIHIEASTKISKATEAVKSNENSKTIEAVTASQNSKATETETIKSSQNSKTTVAHSDVPKSIIANGVNGTVTITPTFIRTIYYKRDIKKESSGSKSIFSKNITLAVFVFGVLAFIAAIVYFVYKMRKEKQHYPYIQTF